MDRHARDALIRHLMTMYDEGDRLAVVRVVEFFTGNTDEHSIGVNLAPSEHVGLAAFRRVLLDEVSRRPDVSSVYIEFAEVPDPDEELDADAWPTASVAFIVTTATVDAVRVWTRELRPRDVAEGWCVSPGVRTPDLDTALHPGNRPVRVWLL